MFTSFSTALSGLNAMTDAIDVVGNNLANLNTTGYKDNSVSFQELIAQALGGSASTQVGLGVTRPVILRQFSQGAVQTTSGRYDAAIQGDGFFVVKNAGNQILYTRAGNFQVDGKGYLVTAGGERVQGWGAVDGIPDTNGALNDIQVPIGQTSQPKATSTFSLNANLNSASTPLVPMSATGSVHDPISLTANNNSFDLLVNGQNITLNLNTADTNLTDVIKDMNTQFIGQGVSAIASKSPTTGGLLITSTATPGTVNAGVQVMPSGSANSTLGFIATSVAAPQPGTYKDPITITPGTNDTLDLNVDGKTWPTITLSAQDGSISDIMNDLNNQFATNGIGLTATATAGKLTLTSTGAAPNASVQVLPTSKASTSLGLGTTTLAASVTGALIKTGVNDQLDLSIDGVTKTFTLGADQNLTAAAADLNTQFTAQGISASAIVSATTGSLTINSATSTIQVLPTGTATSALGLNGVAGSKSVTGSGVSGSITITPGVNDTLSLAVDGAAVPSFTLNPQPSIAALIADAGNSAKFAAAGVTATAVNGQLVLTSQSSGAGASVRVLPCANSAAATLGLTSATGAFLTTPNNRLDLSINGQPKSFTLTGDTSVSAAAADLTAQFTSQGISATASTNASGGLTITSTAAVGGYVQVLPSGTANAILGLTPSNPPPSFINGSAALADLTLVKGVSDTLNLSINGQNQVITLNNLDTSVNDVILDLNSQFSQLGIKATASKDSSTKGLVITSTAVGSNAYVQMLTPTTNSANAKLGLAPSTFSLSAAGTVQDSFTINGSNNTLNLKINGQTVSISLATGDTNLTQVVQDVNSRLTALGVNAVASKDPTTGGLLVTSTSFSPDAGVQVLSGTANSTLGIAQTPTTVTTDNTFSTTVVEPIDSLGNKIPLTITFTRETAHGVWNYSVSSPEGRVAGGTGTARFDNMGNLISVSSPTTTPDGRNETLSITNLPDGAASLNLTWSFFNTDGTPRFTQLAETSAAGATSQDGQAAAALTKVALGDAGEVLATFSDGTQAVAGQMALANFRNPQSLIGVANNNYSIGADTSAPTIGPSGTGGRGTIQGGSLESSTVDIAAEFSNLLVFQRSYQANSRVITVSDELSQETVNLIK